jgi:FXSXX-COOH protein
MLTPDDDQQLDPQGRRSDLVDVSGESLVALRALPETAIARSLRRILSQLDSGVEPVAGFQSAI